MFQIYNKSLSGQFYNVTIQCTVQSRGNPEEPLIGLSDVRDPLWSARVIAAPCDNNPSPLYCEVFSCTDLLSEPRYPAPSVIYCSRSCTLFFVVLIYSTSYCWMKQSLMNKLFHTIQWNCHVANIKHFLSLQCIYKLYDNATIVKNTTEEIS